jgi:diaminopimelate decarboxylase
MKPSAFFELVDRRYFLDVVNRVDTPAYVFFANVVRHRVQQVRDAVGPRFDVLFAVKANPNADILRLLSCSGVGFDVASGGELEYVLAAGAEPRHVEFTGPGKSEDELEAAVRCGVGSINAESLEELDAIAATAVKLGQVAQVGLRINPRSRGGGGIRMGPDNQFGLREDDVPDACTLLQRHRDRLRLVGLHVHAGSQILNATTLVDNVRITLEHAAELEQRCGPLSKVNFGGGWGVEYWDGQSPLDLDAVREQVRAVMDGSARHRLNDACRFHVEPGRFLVAESGVFVVSIRYVKRGYSKLFAIADGGISQNSLLGGGIGQVLRRDGHYEILPKSPSEAGVTTRAVVSGPLCLPHDILLNDAPWPNDVPVRGDRICFFNCGAYGLSASPVHFLGHRPAQEILVEQSL